MICKNRPAILNCGFFKKCSTNITEHIEAERAAGLEVLQVLGSKDVRTFNMSRWLPYHQGRYEEAEPLYERALAIDEKALEPDHPEAATNLNNLAEFYRSQGKYAEAEPLYKRALTIDEKALGPDHPDAAGFAKSLAADLRHLGRNTEAKAYEGRQRGVTPRRASKDKHIRVDGAFRADEDRIATHMIRWS